MAEDRDRVDGTIESHDIEEHYKNNEAAGFEIASLGHSSDVVHVEFTGNPHEFSGDVYIVGGGRKVKLQTLERYRRREKQRMSKSASISDAEREARREEHHQQWQERHERQRKENESRWEERNKREGRILSKEEHMAKDLEEEKKKAARKSTRPLTSFFQPVVKDSQKVNRNTSDTDKTCVSAMDAKEVGDAKDENCTEDKSAFRRGMKVFLRLAFLDNEKVDCMLLKDARKDIRQKGIIGKVTIEEMVDKDVARLNLVEFGALRDYDQREAGRDIGATKFSELKEALHRVEGKVTTKYLTKQNRQFGQNHKWTEEQVEQIRKAVEEAKQQWPDSHFGKAAQILRTRYNGPLFGKISRNQVRNIYQNKVERSSEPKAPVGRPRKHPRALES